MRETLQTTSEFLSSQVQFALVLWWGLMLCSGMFLLFCFLCCCCVGYLFLLQTEEHLMNRDCGEEDVFSSASTSEGSLDVSTNMACRCYCIPIRSCSLNNQKPLRFLMLSQVEVEIVSFLAGLVTWVRSLRILVKLKCNALSSNKTC